MMTFAEIEPGLPPVGYGAVAPLVDLLSDDVRSQLEDPQQLLLDPDKHSPGHAFRNTTEEVREILGNQFTFRSPANCKGISLRFRTPTPNAILGHVPQ